MARARETGFYFEPQTERLALLVEGSPFPSDEQWAYIGDPIEMTPELACLQCQLRWHGVRADEIHVELDLGLNVMLADLAQRNAAELAEPAVPQASTPDLQALLDQAEELQRAVQSLAPLGSVSAEELAAQAEELQLARAAAAISGAAREGRANRELEDERRREQEDERRREQDERKRDGGNSEHDQK